MKHFESTELYYGVPYKLELQFVSSYDATQVMSSMNIKSWKTRTELFKELRNAKFELTDLRTRHNITRVFMYHNNRDKLYELGNKLETLIGQDGLRHVHWYEPSMPIVADQIIMTSKMKDWKYQVSFKYHSSTQLTNWMKTNREFIRIGPSVEMAIVKSWPWFLGGKYMYVKDDKTITLLKLFAGDIISTIKQVIIK